MQQKEINTADSDFHAVEYMRQIREKLSEQYRKDRQKYLNNARQAMEAFKDRVNKVSPKP